MEQRFWEKVEKTDTCWNWTGSIQKGYGYIKGRKEYKKKNSLAHRWSYEQVKGKIPEGLQIDHLCRNRACVNPDHLEAVTQKENVLRGEGIAAKEARQTHCKRGHEFNEKNTLFYRKERHCKICKKIRNQKSKKSIAESIK